MTKKKSKNNMKIVKIVIAIVIAILAVILVILLNPQNIADEKLLEINKSENLDGDLVVPKNFSIAMSKYKGNIKSIAVAKDFNYIIAEAIPYFYKKCNNMDVDKVTSYYEKNTELVKTMLNITSLLDFRNILNEIDSENAKLELTEYRILRDSIKMKDNSNILTSVLRVVYNEDVIIYLNVEVEASNFSYEHPISVKTGVNLEEAEKMYASDLAQDKKEKEEENMENKINGKVGRVVK